jgi:hypothetical protein
VLNRYRPRHESGNSINSGGRNSPSNSPPRQPRRPTDDHWHQSLCSAYLQVCPTCLFCVNRFNSFLLFYVSNGRNTCNISTHWASCRWKSNLWLPNGALKALWKVKDSLEMRRVESVMFRILRELMAVLVHRRHHLLPLPTSTRFIFTNLIKVKIELKLNREP